MSKLHLSPEIIKGLVCPKGRAKWDVFDANCKGLMLEVRQSGGQTYYLRYTDERGRSHQIKLAAATDITLSQARQMANLARSRISSAE